MSLRENPQMMSSQLLERASPAFRRGYNDACKGAERVPSTRGTFYTTDYNDGYEARLVEIHWENVRAARKAA